MTSAFVPPFLLPEPIAVLWLCGKVTLLLSFAWLATAAMRRASAGERHHVWTLALVGALALVVLTPLVPRLRLDAGSRARPLAVQLPEVLSLRQAGTRADAPGVSPPGLRVPLAWGSSLWLLGVLALALRALFDALLLERLARAARATSLARLRSWARAADALPPHARILVSERVAAPVTWGSARPLILLPAAAESWPADRVRAAIAHECAHVRRRDHLVQSLGGAACIVFWFHPLAWRALRALRASAERAADDAALLGGIPAGEYAEHLLQVARAAWEGPEVASGLGMARRTEFERRIAAILDGSRARGLTGRFSRPGLGLAYALALALFASLRVHLGG